jgi:Ca-activated chloride channel family protein
MSRIRMPQPLRRLLTIISLSTITLAAYRSGGADEVAAKSNPDPAAAVEKEVTQGALRIVKPGGGIVECPLKHTAVEADVAGFLARVKVTQTFENPTKEKIEAVYVFPLPHEAAIDDMTMVLGDRKIVGLIKRRAEARSIYEQALQAGQTAALLEQERPNIFTQSVGNIEPGQEIRIEISYVDVLPYDAGTYEFRFPMVVGPRYNPGYPTGTPAPVGPELQGKVAPPASDTSRVPDASRINPPVLKPGYRTGHDIALSVSLDAGVPIQNLSSPNHQAETVRDGDRKAKIKLSAADSLPNKDFVLRYAVVGKKPEMAMLTHTGNYSGDVRTAGNGYFMLMIQPQDDERLTKSPPREIVFLVDVSGSMSGEPTGKCIDMMQGMLKHCRDKDTVQVITFAGDARSLFPQPVPVNPENINKALNFTANLHGGGGTEMLKGIKLAIDQPIDKERLRIVIMLTDGYIGNEAEIIEHVGKHCGDQIRFWCVGIGAAPNLFLIDGVAKQGGGMGKRLGLKDEAAPLAQEIMTRIQRAQLAKLRIDWGPLQVSETYPAKLPELWAGRPVIVFGRYAGGGDSAITVHGNVEGEAVHWPLAVSLPVKQAEHDTLARVWARQKIEDLMQQSYYQGSPAVEEMVTAIALDYRLMSQYTSFVAVDAKQAGQIADPARPPRRMLVPVPLPDGTRWEGFFGEEYEADHPLADAKNVTSLRSSLGRNGIESRRRELASNARGLVTAASSSPMPASPMPAEKPAAASLRRLRLNGDRFANSPVANGPTVMYKKSNIAGGMGGGGGGFGVANAERSKHSYGRMRLGDVGLALDGKAEAKEQGFFDFDGGEVYTANALVGEASRLYQPARKAFEDAQEAQKKGQNSEARTLFVRAYFLLATAENSGGGSDGMSDAALAALEELHTLQVAAASKEMPLLKERLDLVVRDKSLSDALVDLAKASGVKINVIPGSLDDAARLTHETTLRVSYLDLRRATVAQALDWLLQPARLSWRVDQGTIQVSSDRRQDTVTAWVYDVSLLALPSTADLNKLQDHNKAVAEAKKTSDEFMAVVREHLKLGYDSVEWFAPGQILVLGDRQKHVAAEQLFAALADAQPKEKLSGAAGTLQAKTGLLAQKRKADFDKFQAARRLVELVGAHDEFSWQLLAAAADGRLDLEALTELQIAWNNPDTIKLLKGPAAVIVFRSLWAVKEAWRILPHETELTSLSKQAAELSHPAAVDTLTELHKKLDNRTALVSTIFTTLARNEQGDLAHAARRVLLAPHEQAAPLPAYRIVAKALLTAPKDIDRAALTALLREPLQEEDLVVLTALACRRAGGEVWDAFRAQSKDLLGAQPLSGEVVVLINRLSNSKVSLAARPEMRNGQLGPDRRFASRFLANWRPAPHCCLQQRLKEPCPAGGKEWLPCHKIQSLDTCFPTG